MRFIFIVVILFAALATSLAGMLAPGVGLRGAYFEKVDLSGAMAIRYDAAINLQWNADAAPLAEMKPAAFSVQWRGYILPQFSESYSFSVSTAGGVRLFVNNKRVIDDWGATEAPRVSTPIMLTANQLVPVMLAVTHAAGAGEVKMQWSSQSLPKEIIPAARLYPPLFAPAQLVYCEQIEARKSALFITDIFDTPKKLTVDGSFKPVFSPDGYKLLFSTIKNTTYADTSIYSFELQARKLQRLSRLEGEKYDPSFSVDGYSIAFVNQINNLYEIWSMRSDGVGRVKIVADAFENRHPIIGADGSLVYYQSKRDGQWNIYSVKYDGTGEKQLTTLGGSEPTMSRRGDKIVFVSSRTGLAQLYSMDIDGENQLLLCSTPGEVSQPCYIANGNAITFLQKNVKNKTDLFIVDADDKIPCQMTTHGSIVSAALAYTLEIPKEGLSFWFNAQAIDSLTIDANDRVARWEDSTHNGIKAIQTNVDKQPKMVQNAINGLSALRFDGVDDVLDTNTPCKVAEMYVVFKVPTDVFNNFKNVLGNKPGSNRLWFLESGATHFHANPFPLAVWRNGIQIMEQPFNIAPLNQWMVLACDAANANENRIYQICAAEDSYYSEFDVAEIICYNRTLFATERTAVITSLMNKYGIK